MASRNLSSYLYSSHITILEMLEYRGFNVDIYKNYTKNEADIVASNVAKHSPEPIIVRKNKEDVDYCVQVHFLLNKAPTPKNIKDMIETILKMYIEEEDSDSDKTIIIVTKARVTQAVQDTVYALCKEKNVFIQIFCIQSLINVTKHELVPEHTRLSSDHYDELKNVYNLTNINQLPLILDTDPVASFIGLRPGEICRICRPSPTSGQYFVYRLCVQTSF